jgi:signal transduction histidine kinase
LATAHLPILNHEQEIDSLLKRGYATRMHDLAASIAFTEEALKKATQHKLDTATAKAKNQLSLFLLIKGEFEEALQLANEALTYFESAGLADGIAAAQYNLGSVYYRTDNYHLALRHLLEALRLYDEAEDYFNKARVLKAIGTAYEFFNDYENAAKSYLKCIEASRKVGDLNSESNAYNPLSGLFLKKGDIEQAMITIENSIHIKKQIKDLRGLPFALYGRGKVYLKKKDYAQALQDFNESLALQIKNDDKLGIGMVYNKLGLCYQGLGDIDNARNYLQKALELSKQFNMKFIQFKAYYNIYSLERSLGNVSEALKNLEQYISLKESVINTETLNIIKSYEAISKIQSLEQEARSEKEKSSIIEEKNKELDSFFYRVSHDLKGPISSLLGLHPLVKVDIHDAHSLNYFTMYHNQILRINDIVMSLIDITRMKHLEVKRVSIDFYQMVDDCISSYSYFENFGKITFIKEIESGISFKSEWAIVNTIVQNLIENAIKYASDTSPFVKISVYVKDSLVYISVEDNGQGIPQEHQSKIFDMFHRANDRVQGSGLGLYILKRAVERLKGSIEVTSALQLGSCFTVKLPV